MKRFGSKVGTLFFSVAVVGTAVPAPSSKQVELQAQAVAALEMSEVSWHKGGWNDMMTLNATVPEHRKARRERHQRRLRARVERRHESRQRRYDDLWTVPGRQVEVDSQFRHGLLPRPTEGDELFGSSEPRSRPSGGGERCD